MVFISLIMVSLLMFFILVMPLVLAVVFPAFMVVFSFNNPFPFDNGYRRSRCRTLGTDMDTGVGGVDVNIHGSAAQPCC